MYVAMYVAMHECSTVLYLRYMYVSLTIIVLSGSYSTACCFLLQYSETLGLYKRKGERMTAVHM